MESLQPHAIEIARFLIDLSLKSVLIIAVASLATIMLRKSSAAAKHFIWFAAVAAIWALPLLGMMLPAVDLNILSSEMLTGQSIAENQKLAEPPTFDEDASPEHEGLLSFFQRIVWYGGLDNSSIQAETSNTASPIFGLVVVWAAGASVVLVSLLFSSIAVRRLARKSVIAPDGFQRLSEKLACESGIRGSVSVAICTNAPAPFTCGVFKRLIILDEGSATGSPEAIRSILLHELAHIKRADILTQALAQLVCVIQWFNPLAWLVARRMIVERELACDNFVLNSGVKASSYARQLLEIAASSKPNSFRFMATTAMARRNSFKERMMSILNPLTNRRGAGRVSIISGALIATLTALSLAAIHPWFEPPLLAASKDAPLISVAPTAPQEIEGIETLGEASPGDPFIIALNISKPDVKVEALFLGQTIIFRSIGGQYKGIGLVPESAQIGDAEYQVIITTDDGRIRRKTYKFEIVPRRQRSVLLDKLDTLKGIKDEQTQDQQSIESTLAESKLEPQWTGQFIKPTEGRVSLPFATKMILGEGVSYVHSGVDLAVPQGTPIKSTNTGKVAVSKLFPGYGNTVVVDHGGGIFSLYAHLQECSVNVGQMVKKGDVIGLCGSTGKSSGPHLHWSISINGEYCDPLKLIEEK